MSGEVRPISPARFAEAIEDLPIENLYAKAFEINNSIAHLQHSNAALQEYSDSIKNDESLDAAIRAGGDSDCLEAIKENEVVIERQQERVRLLKAEVERRGGRWHETSPAEKNDAANGDPIGGISLSNGTTASSAPQAPARLTDEQLRQQLEARMAGDDEEGMHL